MPASYPNHFSKSRGRTVPIQIAAYRGYLSAEYDNKKFIDLLQSVMVSGDGLGDPLKVSKSSQVYRFRYGSEAVYLKRYPYAGMKTALQALCRSSKALKSWRIGRQLLQKGIDTPPPIFYLRRWISWVTGEHILGTLGIQNSMSLRDYVNQNFKEGHLSQRDKRLFVCRAAEFLGRLHMAGVYHGDLTARNILVTSCGEVQHLHFVLIDLDAIRSTHGISRRRRIKNLDELGRNFLDLKTLSIRDRGRFLKHYLNRCERERSSFKRLFREVEQRTARRLIKHGQRFRT